MATTLANINIKDSSSWNTLLNLTYPVGSVYVSYTSTSPATRFGGTWTAITGRFPYFNAGTRTGGSNTQALTIAQLPSHSHKLRAGAQGDLAGWGGSGGDRLVYAGVSGTRSIWEFYKEYTTETGSGSAHNNMPAYQTLYAWHRTA